MQSRLKSVLEMHEIHPSAVEGAILSSVVPPLNSTILRAVEKDCRASVRFSVGPGIKTGINILMAIPKPLAAT